MSVRCKVQLIAVTAHAYNPNARTLKFSAVYDQSIPEDQRFQKATPSASFEQQVDNPAALEQFTLGQFYYADFSPVPVADTGG